MYQSAFLRSCLCCRVDREWNATYPLKACRYITSGMMGYIPNPSEAAVSHDGMTGYRVQGNPHVDDASSASFNSQISGIFKVAGSS